MTDVSYNYHDITGISTTLKSITLNKVKREWDAISCLTTEQLETLNGRSKLGCDTVDYYFFTERLVTVGKKGINFFDFLRDIEYYKTKHYIQTLLSFCDKNNRYTDSLVKRYYYIYGLCFGRINAFKITNAVKIYKTYPCSKILDPFCGFGGRLFGAMIASKEYRGFDKNKHLQEKYEHIHEDFSDRCVAPFFIDIVDCLDVDYDKLSLDYPYDMVFTSPPYKNIEIYRCSSKKSDDEWSEFYTSLFTKVWKGLVENGYFIININEEVYLESLVPLFGECREKILLTKTKKNSYDEYIYVWIKSS